MSIGLLQAASVQGWRRWGRVSPIHCVAELAEDHRIAAPLYLPNRSG